MTHTTRKPFFVAFPFSRLCLLAAVYAEQSCMFIHNEQSSMCVWVCVCEPFFQCSVMALEQFLLPDVNRLILPYPLPHLKHCLPFSHPHTHTHNHTLIHLYSYVNSQILIACPIAPSRVSSISFVYVCVWGISYIPFD